VFLPLFTTNDFQLEPRYYDYQTDLHWRASPRDDVDFLVFGSDDTLHLAIRRPDPTESPTADSHTYYHRALVRWLHRLGAGASITNAASVGYDVPFQFVLNAGNSVRTVDVETLEYNLRSAAHIPLRPWIRLDAGFDFEGERAPISAIFPQVGGPREGDPGGF